MYCPICQAMAAQVNELHELLRASAKADSMPLVGVGADNSLYEVDFFRKKYAIPFPLLADPDRVFYDACGADGTPYFLLLRKAKDGSIETLYAHSGRFEDAADFLATIMQKAGAPN